MGDDVTVEIFDSGPPLLPDLCNPLCPLEKAPRTMILELELGDPLLPNPNNCLMDCNPLDTKQIHPDDGTGVESR